MAAPTMIARVPYFPPQVPSEYDPQFERTQFANIARSIPPTVTRTVTANATIAATDDTILVDTTAGAITITLLPANQVQFLRVQIKNIAASICTLSGTIDGTSSWTLSHYQSITIQSDGVSWRSVTPAPVPGLIPGTAYGIVGGTGVDMATRINAALVDAGVDKANVVLPQGTILYGAQIAIPTFAGLVGVGMGRTILQQSAGANLAVSVVCAANGAAQRVANLTLDANQTQNTGLTQSGVLSFNYATDPVVDFVEVRQYYGLGGGTGTAISLGGVCQRGLVQFCYIHDCGDIAALRQSDGVYSSGDNNRIRYNTFKAMTDTAVVAEAGINPQIIGNLAIDCVQGYAMGAGIASYTSAGGIMADNECVGMTRYNGVGFLVYRYGGTATNKMIVRNNISRDGVAGCAFRVVQSSYVTMSGNDAINQGGTWTGDERNGVGFSIRNSDHIDGGENTVSGCGRYGVQISGVTDWDLSFRCRDNMQTPGAGTPYNGGIIIEDGPAEGSYGAPQNVATARGRLFGGYSKGATQNYGIVSVGTCTTVEFDHVDLSTNGTAPISNTATGPFIIKDCNGYNPVGPSAVTVTASPMTYTAGSSPETLYVKGGTVTTITKGGVTLATATDAAIPVSPAQAVIITYTVAPTMAKDIQ